MQLDNNRSKLFDKLEVDTAGSGYYPCKESEHEDEGRDNEVMEYALRAVGLWDDLVVSQGAGFGSPLREEALSRGQRQMFGLARAIMRARWLVRATKGRGSGRGRGNADTNMAMWTVILREFQGYTIVRVAHRLLHITECHDKVIVMGNGRVVQVGSPDELPDKRIASSESRGNCNRQKARRGDRADYICPHQSPCSGATQNMTKGTIKPSLV
ncbi:hypothetical protein B0H63DRAFT_455216 [Podospora didyma]|uniref:ABC transporter n=1 Tax=Podospora didyma TaxID=330526 RepID=A0AAE0K1W0_9PEZI|nr:hypothetical protein B0H63DRAFT_455216 [Podospora didyma]